MSIVLFALIRAKLHMGVAYWICFGTYCIYRCVKNIIFSDILSENYK